MSPDHLPVPPVVAARGLGHAFRGHVVLADLDLDLDLGVTALLGPNGAGKTTLVRLLATVLPVRSGRLEIGGHDVADPVARREARAGIGYLPQAFGGYRGMTVEELVAYLAWCRGLSSSEARRAAADALETVGLADRRRAKVRTLSGGMRRRVGIAQAIATAPGLILLDEPTVGLDPEQRIRFRALLRRLGERAAVVVSTHLVEDVASACDRALVLADGRLRFDGTVHQLVDAGVDERPDVDVDADSEVERGYLAVVADASVGQVRT